MKSFIAKILTLQRKLKFKREEMSTHHKLNFGLELEMGLYGIMGVGFFFSLDFSVFFKIS